MRWLRVGFAVCVAACGDNLHPAPDAPAFAEAPHPDVPQLVKVSGNVLATPKIVPIFFAGDDPTVQSQIESLAGQLGASSYWQATTSEYGVGAVDAEPTIVTSDPAPTTNAALVTWLTGHFTGSDGWPATPDPDAIYTVFLPAGLMFAAPGIGKACKDYGGYHLEALMPQGESIVYALVARCTSFTLSTLDETTRIASHEWIEAVTDPRVGYVDATGNFVTDRPAYGDVDPSHEAWAYLPGAEAGDMCQKLDNQWLRGVGNIVVQRTWSNVAALAGADPCVPAGDEPYLGAAPVLDESVLLNNSFTGVAAATSGIQLAVNESKTIEVDLFSDQPGDAWTIVAEDAGRYQGRINVAELLVQWSGANSGTNGTKLLVTITRLRASQTQGSEFVLSSQRDGMTVAQWWGYVAN